MERICEKYQTSVHLVIKESNLAESYKMACATNPELALSKIISVPVVAAMLKMAAQNPHTMLKCLCFVIVLVCCQVPEVWNVAFQY